MPVGVDFGGQHCNFMGYDTDGLSLKAQVCVRGCGLDNDLSQTQIIMIQLAGATVNNR
jgi:hypothetical protein